MQILILLLLYGNLLDGFQINIISTDQNNKLSELIKVIDILEKIHKIDYEYSNKSAILEIEYISTDKEWKLLIDQHLLPEHTIAFFVRLENKIYYSKNGLKYDTILHEYFHFISSNGLNESISYDLQSDIIDDYYDYVERHNKDFPYWKSNYMEFSAYMFSLWFNTLYELEIDGIEKEVYDQNKKDLLNGISPRLLKNLQLIYGEQNICELTNDRPLDDIEWCDEDYKINQFIIKNNLELYMYLLILMINIYYIYYVAKHTSSVYDFLLIMGLYMCVSYIGMGFRLLNIIGPKINMIYGINFIILSIISRIILWRISKSNS